MKYSGQGQILYEKLVDLSNEGTIEREKVLSFKQELEKFIYSPGAEDELRRKYGIYFPRDKDDNNIRDFDEEFAELIHLLNWLELPLKNMMSRNDFSVAARIVQNNRLLRMSLANLVLRMKKEKNARGVKINDVRQKLYIFIDGPFHFGTRPSECTSEEILFPGTYFTVLKSYNKENVIEIGTNSSKKYFCASFRSALNLARKMEADTGVKIINCVRLREITNGSSSDDDAFLDAKKAYLDFLGGDLSNEWNID